MLEIVSISVFYEVAALLVLATAVGFVMYILLMGTRWGFKWPRIGSGLMWRM